MAVKKLGFDPKKYIREQSEYILQRVNGWEKLYLEFGGKLMNDTHAMRCLPGYRENAKLELLETLKDQAEIIISVGAGDIEKNKKRADFGITYDMEVLRLIDDLRSYNLDINSVVITRYEGQIAAKLFRAKLEQRGIRTYVHNPIPGYPFDIDRIVSEEGYGANEYIETTKPLVVVTAPGPGSGKLATCLSQVYNEQRRGTRCYYAKFETFPVWNMPLKHPLNVAYEAATADLSDFNMLDSYHLDAYGVTSINYNRDMEMFPVVRRILDRITGESVYKSPTDMGVNRIATGIVDDDVISEASRQEIIRRYLRAACDHKRGIISNEIVQRNEFIMETERLKPEDRTPVLPARAYHSEVQKRFQKSDGVCAVAIELPDGTMITGRQSEQMSAPAAALLNAVKFLGDIPDAMRLLPNSVLDPILDLKVNRLKDRHHVLNAEEALMALSLSAVLSPSSKTAVEKLSELRGAQAHCTRIVTQADEALYRKLGIDLTCDDIFFSDLLFV